MIFKSDKLDYLGGPRKEFFFDNFFSIRQGPSNVGKLIWNLLVFFSFIFSLGQCVIGVRCGIYSSSVENKKTTVGMLVKFMLNTNSIIGECTALNKFQLHICSG